MDAGVVELDGQRFTVADGFTVERVAGPGLVDRPVVASFDERGFLYVAEASGTNEKVEVQLEKRPHRILRLEDRDGDGEFDARTVFADGLMLPEGVLWYDGSVYVGAPPSIWKLTDTNGDGVAEKREEWFDGKTLTGCANDIHGPYLGRDGWIYWCKGAFAEQTYERPGRAPLVTRAAHVFRRRPEGGVTEVVMTGGMDNPVDVVMSETGERFFTTTFLQHPGGGKRDGVIHAVYGGVWGKDHGVLEGHVRTGDLMPVTAHLGPAAPCGLEVYDSGAFGDGWRGNLLAAQFNLQSVVRIELEREGATFRSEVSDFLRSDSFDFHPTDVLEDKRDGSVLVVDTGGWYKLCCPTSQLAKPDVLGAIYRVRKVEMGPVVAMDVDLARVWEANRAPGEESSKLVREGLQSGDERVVLAALHGAGLKRDRRARGRLVELLSGSAPVARGAAEALGRIGDGGDVEVLLEVAGGERVGGDRVLEHSLIYALVEIGDPGATRAGLGMGAAGSVKAALVALDQMEAGGLEVGEVVGLIGHGDERVREAAWGVVERRPEWGGEVVEKLGVDAPAGLVAKLSAEAVVQAWVAARRRLDVMGEARLKVVPGTWVAVLKESLEAGDPAVLKIVSKWGDAEVVAKLRGEIEAVVLDGSVGEAVRVEALGALGVVKGSGLREGVFEVALGLLDSGVLVWRQRAVGVLRGAKLRVGQRVELAKAMGGLGAMEVAGLWRVFESSREDEVGRALVAALGDSVAVGVLKAAEIDLVARGFSDEIAGVIRGWAGGADEVAKLEALLAELEEGDVLRGQAVFNGAKAGCRGCHAIGYVGGALGPDLSRIAGGRTRRDLLEAIVFPSASLVRSYETLGVRKNDGTVVGGILRSESGSEVVLATGLGTEVRIGREEIGAIEPLGVSLMPPGMEAILTRQELADLLAFLESRR